MERGVAHLPCQLSKYVAMIDDEHESDERLRNLALAPEGNLPYSATNCNR